MVGPPSPLLAAPGMTAELQRAEGELRASVRTEDPYLTEVASHLVLAGGKRLRPALAVAAGAAAGGSALPVAVEVVRGGVACELVHLGSLYHDDVIDEAQTRRGVATVNARWGNLRAILAGDFLLARASEIAASLGTEVAALLAATIGRLCEGEVRELQTAFQPDRSEDQYLAAVRGKTASLFASACRIGALAAGAERPAVEAATGYGLAYGMAFQVVDDVLDVVATDEELGKPSGQDLTEGIYTLPVLRTLAAGGDAAGELRELLGSPVAGDDLDRARKLVKGGDGVAEALAVAAGFGAEARSHLAGLPDGPLLDHLAAATDGLLASVPAA